MPKRKGKEHSHRDRGQPPKCDWDKEPLLHSIQRLTTPSLLRAIEIIRSILCTYRLNSAVDSTFLSLSQSKTLIPPTETLDHILVSIEKKSTRQIDFCCLALTGSPIELEYSHNSTQFIQSNQPISIHPSTSLNSIAVTIFSIWLCCRSSSPHFNC